MCVCEREREIERERERMRENESEGIRFSQDEVVLEMAGAGIVTGRIAMGG